MKIIKQLFVVAVALVAFGSCQKELGLGEDGVSFGSLKKSTLSGYCTPATVTGIFRKDSTLNNDNFVDVQVNVVLSGTFDIKSDTVDGFSFRKTGDVGQGLNTIRLYPSGKPLAAGTFTFTIKYDSSFCTFDITVVEATAGAAIYTLENSGGNCTTFTSLGTYSQGVPLGAGNTVAFDVSVTVPGTYSITTTNNGMTFSNSGVFINPGTQQVTLVGSGTPLNAGSILFNPIGGTSTCAFTINVSGTTPAAFTLNGDPGSCAGVIVGGTYTAGTPLNAADTVVVFANVTTPGNYTISTATTNGITFSKSGTFSVTGTNQRVVLQGTGTPVAASTGTNYTAASAASTSCIFSIVVVPGTTPTNNEYIPETVGSNWTDSLDMGTSADTSYILVTPRTTVQALNTYRIFTVTDATGTFDSTYHRSSLGKYYQYIYGDYGIFDNPVNTPVLLLDSTLAVNGTWTVNFPANTAGGTPTTLRIDAKILAKGATATVAGNGYSNIIKVQFTYQVDQGTGFIPVVIEEFWYAKGKGLIKDIQNNLLLGSTDTYLTRRVQIF